MPGVQLPTRLGSFKRSKINKGKGKQPATASDDFDGDNGVFDPQDFNPFDQPDMCITPDGRLPKASNLDPYSIVEAPLQILTQLIDSSMKRSKTVGASSPRPRRGADGNNPGLAHQRIRALRVEDRHSIALDGPHIRRSINRPSQRRPISVIPEQEEMNELSTKEQPRNLRRVSGIRTLRADRPCLVAPMPGKVRSSPVETSEGQLWVTANEILEPRTNEPISRSLNECLESQLQRRTSNRSPDSGVSGVSTSQQNSNSKGKGKEVVLDEQPLPAETSKCEQGLSTEEASQTEQQADRGRPQTRLQRTKSRSCPAQGSRSWLDSAEGRRGRPLRESFDEARIEQPRVSSRVRNQQRYEKEAQEELEVILQRNEMLKKELLERHMQKALNAAGHRPSPIDSLGFLANPTQCPGDGEVRWIRNGVPIIIHKVPQLRYVSSVRWTPKTDAAMTSGKGADIEDAGDFKVGFREKIRIKWNKWRNKEFDGVRLCAFGQIRPDQCRERRLRRQYGPDPGKIC